MIAPVETKRKPRFAEQTGIQTISYSFGTGILRRDYSKVGTFAQLRAVRRDPTVQLARALLISCIQAGYWNIEADDDVSPDVLEFMEHILPLREDFLYNAIAFGKVDFGFCPFEKIFRTDGNRIYIEMLKPLLVDMTHILVTKRGRFNGFRQRSMGWGTLGQTLGTAPAGVQITGGPTYPIDLGAEKCFLASFAVEGGNLYGIPLLENIRAIKDMWDECNDGARRYDKKLAGSHWVVYYPPGTGLVDGVATDNGVIAASMLEVLESSGRIALPTTIAEVMQEVTNTEVASLYAWRVEILSETKPKQESFNKRMQHLEALMVRGLLFPERAVLEGQHGTKAESGEQINLMMNNMEELDRTITRMVNQQLVDQLLRLNFGDAMVGKVRLASAPLIDKQVGFLRDLYMKQNDQNIDMVAMKEKLDVPEAEGGSETKPEEPPEGDNEDE